MTFIVTIVHFVAGVPSIRNYKVFDRYSDALQQYLLCGSGNHGSGPVVYILSTGSRILDSKHWNPKPSNSDDQRGPVKSYE